MPKIDTSERRQAMILTPQEWARQRNLSYGSLIGIRIRLRQLRYYRSILPYEAHLLEEAEDLVAQAIEDWKARNAESKSAFLWKSL